MSGLITFQQVPDHFLHIYALDVGQGDSLLVKTEDNKYILVDSGMNFDVVQELQKVLPFWKRKIDLIILTHPDQDHAGGFPKLLEIYDIGEIIYWPINNPNLAFNQMKKIIDSKANVYSLTSKDDFNIGCCTYIDIVWPDKPLDLESDIKNVNDTSVSFVLKVEGFSMFFGGDLGWKFEEEIFTNNQYDLDVIKVGHHGSDSSTSIKFLKMVQPEYAVISVGENNYGHPKEEILDALRSQNVKILRTDIMGTIDLKFDGESLVTKY